MPEPQIGTVWQVDARPGQVRLQLESPEPNGDTFWVAQVLSADEAARLADALLAAFYRAHEMEDANAE
jgi:hypothetical protein